jgi:hypothetical protein
MNIRPRRVQLKTIKIKENQVCELAKTLDIRLDNESIREILEIGTKSPYSEEQLQRTIRELEDRKKKLENDFREIALQRTELESKYVGLRTQIGKIFRDNLVQVFHLCSRTPNGTYERLARDELIHKYIKLSKAQ